MKFSIILCTVDRYAIVSEFLMSLVNQSYRNFELIIVDQNSNDNLLEIVNKFRKNINIKYIKSSRGLSKSRNVAMYHSSGDVLCFPDDDCTYPPKLLENICSTFRLNDQMDFLLGRTISKHTGKISAGKDLTKSMPVRRSGFGGSSTTLFINFRSEKPTRFLFDEAFGVGAAFYCEEENDLIIRMLKDGMQGHYIPEKNYVFHPEKDYDYFDLERASTRGFGFGALTAKHIFSLAGFLFFVKYLLIRTPVSILVYLIKGNIILVKYISIKYINMWKGFYLYFTKSNINE